MAPKEHENDDEMPLSRAGDGGADEGRGDGGEDAPSEDENEEADDYDDCSDMSEDEELFVDIHNPDDPCGLNGLLISDSDVEEPSEIMIEHLFWKAEHDLKMQPIIEEHRRLIECSRRQDEYLPRQQELLDEVRRAVEEKE